jgi:hypothetical protein
VTRSGDFSPVGRLLTLGSFSTPIVAKISGLLFFHGKSYAFILTQNRFGRILGHCFTNSSGHPVRKVPHLRSDKGESCPLILCRLFFHHSVHGLLAFAVFLLLRIASVCQVLFLTDYMCICTCVEVARAEMPNQRF